MGKMSKVGWLIGLVKHAVWAVAQPKNLTHSFPVSTEVIYSYMKRHAVGWHMVYINNISVNRFKHHSMQVKSRLYGKEKCYGDQRWSGHCEADKKL
jgi:hypothetical protein